MIDLNSIHYGGSPQAIKIPTDLNFLCFCFACDAIMILMRINYVK